MGGSQSVEAVGKSVSNPSESSSGKSLALIAATTFAVTSLALLYVRIILILHSQQ